MLEGFKNFLMRGNVVDLAVGVIIAGAFGKIVDSIVKDIITPIIGLAGGQPDFSAIRILGKLNEKTNALEGGIAIGNFINAVIGFVILAAVVYFVIVVPINKLKKAELPTAPAGPTPDQALLTEIRDLLRK
jgi:large conductance mechanosensitive channel